MHPFINKVRAIKNYYESNDLLVTEYIVWGRKKWLGLFSINHPMKVKRYLHRDLDKLVFETYSFPNVTVTSHFSFSPSSKSVVINDEVTIKAPRLLASYVSTSARAIHQTILGHLKIRLEK